MNINFYGINQIKEDFIALVDNKDNLTPEMRRNIFKGVLRDFFDYLEEKLEKH